MNQQQNAALESMKEWLAHPDELGKEPVKIELAGEFDLHELHYYIFKYKKSILGKWLLGVCGGYEPGETQHCGHVFSEMDPYEEASAKEKAIAMVEMIRSYWMEQAQQYEAGQMAQDHDSGENKEEKEGILDIKLTLNGNKKINIEMQNTYQEDWTERSLFYNCRMFTEGFKKGEPYWKLSPCIHIGILNFNMMKSPGYYHKVTLRDEKTNELYSRKFQFHMIELKKTKTTKGKARKHPLYRWARLIAATTWEEVAQESAGNRYMERIQEEMVKMSQDERDRYLYLREEMAASDRVSQLQSAENRGVRAGKLLSLIHI